MTAHKGVNLTKLVSGRWSPQDVKENSACIRVVDDTIVALAASGDTIELVAPPKYAKLDLMTSVIFISTLSATAVFDVGSDSGATGAQTLLLAGQTAPTGKKLTFDTLGFFNKEWDGGKLMFTFSGSFTAVTTNVSAQLTYKDVP